MTAEHAAAAFRTAFVERDFAPAAAVLHDDAELRSPVLARPWRTKPVLERLGPAMVGVLDDVAFADDVVGERRAVLSFTARRGAREVEGVLLLDVGDDGLVERLAILLRPLSGLQAVAAAMATAVDDAPAAEHRR